MNKLIPFALLGLVTTAAQAQIVIGDGDFPSAGTTITFGSDDDVTNLTLNLGSASATPQTWNFSVLQTDTLYDIGFYDPTTISGGSDFPTADLAVDQFGGYAFADVTAGSVQILGLNTDFGVVLGLPVPFLASIPAEDPWTIFTFPSSVGTSYNDIAIFDAKFPSTGLIPSPFNLVFNPDSVRFKRHITTQSLIDAEGALTDVLGTVHPVLRQSFNEFTVDTIWGYSNSTGQWTLAPNFPGIFSNPSISDIDRLRYISKTLGYFVVQITLDGNGQPASATFKSDASQCCTSVEEVVARGGNVIYPNPASSAINVRTGGEMYTFEILDLSGKLVASHALSYDNQSVSIDALSNGLYVFRMISTDGRTAHAGRLSVVK
jgi:hypothetical protein